MKKIENLIFDFEEMNLELNLLSETFKLLEEGLEKSHNFYPQALIYPVKTLSDISTKLNIIQNDMHTEFQKIARRHESIDKKIGIMSRSNKNGND